MADISKISPDDGSTILNIKDSTARTGVNNAFKVMGEMGAKNLLKITKDNLKAWNTSGTWNGDVYTLNGFTFTLNDDESVTISAGTAPSGTETMFQFMPVDATLPLPAGSYILNGNPNNPSSSTNFLHYKIDNTWNDDTNNGDLLVTVNSQWQRLEFVIKRNSVISAPITVKPMIRLSDDPDTTFRPSAMTNRELSKKVVGITYPKYPSSTSVSDLIKGVIQTYIANNGLDDGETHTVKTSIDTVGYYIISLTKSYDRVIGVAIKDDVTLYVYRYIINNQTITIKSATLNAV